MNYLGHSNISIEIDKKYKKETLYGNFTGDFYKGRIENINLENYLKEGIKLHRIIDSISDREENKLNILLKDKFGIFKGIVSDIFIDHFISKNSINIFGENIEIVEKNIITQIKNKKNYFPDEFNYVFNWIKEHKVLSGYKNIDFLERVFIGMSQRVTKGDILLEAIKVLKNNYSEIEDKSLKEFLYVKEKSIENFINKN